MATIPVPDHYRSRVREAGLPTVRVNERVSPDDFGAGVAEQVGRLGQAGAAIYERARKKQQSTQVMDAYARLSDTDLQIREHVRSVRGKNAVAITSQDERGEGRNEIDSALQNYEANLQAIRGEIQDEEARDAFDAIAVKRRESFQQFVSGHVAQQGEVAAKDSAGAAATSAINSASAFARHAAEFEASAAGAASEQERTTAGKMAAFNRRMLEQTIAEGKQAIETYARSQGLDAGGSVLRYTTEARVRVLESFLEAGAAESAASYLDKHRSEIDPDAAKKIAKSVADVAEQVDAVRQEERLFAETEGDPLRFVQAAEQIGNERVRELVLDRHDARRRRLEAGRIASDSPRLGELKHIYLTQGLRPQGKLYSDLSIQGKATIDAWWRAERDKRRGEAGDRVQQTIKSRFRALDLTGKPGEDQVSVAVLGNPMFDGATEETLNTIIAWQKTAAKDLQNDNGVSRGDFKLMIEREAGALELKPKSLDHAAFRDHLQEQWDFWRDDPANDDKKRPPPADVQRWIEDAAELLVKGQWWPFADVKKPRAVVQRRGLEGFRPAGKPAPVEPSAPQKAPDDWLRLTDGARIIRMPPGSDVPEGWQVIP